MHAPKFWRHRTLGAFALTPLSTVWCLSGFIKNIFVREWHSPVPIICVGNLITGGAGKTPVAIAISEKLKKIGAKPHLLSRGYGGTLRGPIKVNINSHFFREVGDEPLILAKKTPTWVSKNRVSGAQAAIKDGASIIVMDDGYQNKSLSKTLSILVFDGEIGMGNRMVMPAGPLRETIKSGKVRADAIIIIGDDQSGIEKDFQGINPILHAKIAAVPDTKITNKNVLAFSGIGYPDKFFKTLREIGCKIVEQKSFKDHHPFKDGEIKMICDRATELDAVPVTTEKDFVRLPLKAKKIIHPLRIRLEWEIEGDLDLLLEKVSLNGAI
ncbi:MAG: tetraacyldisaccharide 4'-kinase [Pseudomonadota bacterium]|nr:tetraacyldisaccharide 4'-kinase [Pseudomonadota bacterium]